MTSTRCERQGQVEIGIIENEGWEFAALGASVVGRNITGYTKGDRHGITLTTWCGKTMLECRCEIVERYWSGSLALMFRLPHGRFIVGYALGESGMLFRGELIEDGSDDDARRQAAYLAQFFGELDAEDEEAFQTEIAEA
ncbi:hypothetical protein [Rubinisphaera brasiliensis]|uniref:Uncharacterized protein n=1 Tax=Rubinisphaera brasiliensis (strain ATCC 49424 / DSM 5305 / JCM 21570 / IAM 15109 / NBRC 103401 / IFAM 1448) TaxID=756272 RepID=F0SLN4_RUBBR|nr:hypothetical protein [Rubinisphaera brasiliensis]ADY58775.1 hypothetical protein Plabr_1159 [Rubinisphaera brasiliensis DSM 5305]